jgi:chemotaxis protein methyltransferase CheR
MPVLALASTDLTDAQFEQISALVKSLCGINLREGKKELVKARLGKRLRTLNMPSFDAYFDHLRDDQSGDELIAMLDAISTNLTNFFREPGHFDHLIKFGLPEIQKRASQGTRRLRIWSAGCSSGEEPYSIAITLHEHLPPIHSWDARILATDLSTRVLSVARQGVYAKERLQDVPGAMLMRYFTQIEGRPHPRYQVNADIRGMVTFARLNLMETWPMKGPFDVIFCRNVMIYFDKQTQDRLIGRYFDLLRPGGLLLVGHSESLAGVAHRFTYVRPTIYRRP